MRHSLTCIAALLIAATPALALQTPALTRLPTTDRVVALTFDACEAGKVAHLDHAIADFLVQHRIPFTVFMGGKFARDNAADAKWLAEQPFVEIENHSWSHNNHMPGLPDARVAEEVTKAADEIAAVTGRRTRMFRFPAGNSDSRTRAIVEGLGYRVIQWRWAVGDPVRQEKAPAIVATTLKDTQPGDLIIYHINGRGWHTAEALPKVIDGLTREGYRFVLLSDYLDGSATGPAATARR